MMDVILWPLTAWHWLAFAVLLLGGEILTPTTYLLWPSTAAALMGVLLWLVPSMSWQVQVILFALASLASNFIWFFWQKRHPGTAGNPNLNRRTSLFIGRRVPVEGAFVDGRGSVRVDDSIWQARTEDGRNPEIVASVEITGAEGTCLIVK